MVKAIALTIEFRHTAERAKLCLFCATRLVCSEMARRFDQANTNFQMRDKKICQTLTYQRWVNVKRLSPEFRVLPKIDPTASEKFSHLLYRANQ